jgi:hypothetical protein
MPLSQLERDVIAKGCATCKQVLLDLQPKIAAMNEIYNATGGASSTITQGELDEEAALSGLTKAQLDDALFALTSGILPAIVAGYTALAQLGARTL